MSVEVVELPLAGLKLLRPKVFADERGFFVETWNRARAQEAGVDVAWVQDNHSRSTKHTVRGLHFQRPSGPIPGQAKLIRCARGSIFDVVVDVRPDSKTYRQWYGVQLDDVAHEQLFIPVGFAHGFCVLSDVADVAYKVSSLYDPATETGFFWNDPSIGVRWPVDVVTAVVSKRDRDAKMLADIPHP